MSRSRNHTALMIKRARSRRRDGVALLAVLWVLAAAGTAAALGLAVVRDGIATSRYRTEHSRARWVAEGCLTEFRARLERVLETGARSASYWTPSHGAVWIDPGAEIPEGCVVLLEAPLDGPVDINSATDSALLTLPGFDAAVVDVVRREHQWGRRLQSLDELLGAMPPGLRDRLVARYAELVPRVAFVPPAWLVTGVSQVSGRPYRLLTEQWVLAGNRIGVVWRELR